MRNFRAKYPTVITNDYGQHQIVLPSGETLYGTISTQTTDDCDDFPVVSIKCFCNIAKDHEDAMNKYRQLEEEEARSK